ENQAAEPAPASAAGAQGRWRRKSRRRPPTSRNRPRRASPGMKPRWESPKRRAGKRPRPMRAEETMPRMAPTTWRTPIPATTASPVGRRGRGRGGLAAIAGAGFVGGARPAVIDHAGLGGSSRREVPGDPGLVGERGVVGGRGRRLPGGRRGLLDGRRGVVGRKV